MDAKTKFELTRRPNTVESAEVIDCLRREGYCIVEGLADDALLTKIAEELDPYIERTTYGSDQLNGLCTRRTGALLARSKWIQKLIMHPLILETVGSWLSHATAYQLSQAQVLSVGPGAKLQPIHVDEVAWDFFEFPNDYQLQCNTLWAMSDSTEEMGATRIIPGSHKFPVGLRYKLEDTIAAEMKRGDCLIYSGKIYHGAGPNLTTDKIRKLINNTYTVAWLRQEENMFLSVPREVAETLPDDVLRLIGYQHGAPGIGLFGDSQDPMAAIRSLPYEQYSYKNAVKKKLGQQTTDYGAAVLAGIEDADNS